VQFPLALPFHLLLELVFTLLLHFLEFDFPFVPVGAAPDFVAIPVELAPDFDQFFSCC